MAEGPGRLETQIISETGIESDGKELLQGFRILAHVFAKALEGKNLNILVFLRILDDPCKVLMIPRHAVIQVLDDLTAKFGLLGMGGSPITPEAT